MAITSIDEHKVSHLGDGYWSSKVPFVLIADDYTIKDDQSGYVFGIATDAKTISLPAVSADNKGMVITIINMGAEGNNIVTISPEGNDGVKGNGSKSAGSNADATTADGIVFEASGTNGADIVNTKATANQGDRITLMSDGDADWWILDAVGIWASAS